LLKHVDIPHHPERLHASQWSRSISVRDLVRDQTTAAIIVATFVVRRDLIRRLPHAWSTSLAARSIVPIPKVLT